MHITITIKYLNVGLSFSFVFCVPLNINMYTKWGTLKCCTGSQHPEITLHCAPLCVLAEAAMRASSCPAPWLMEGWSCAPPNTPANSLSASISSIWSSGTKGTNLLFFVLDVMENSFCGKISYVCYIHEYIPRYFLCLDETMHSGVSFSCNFSPTTVTTMPHSFSHFESFFRMYYLGFIEFKSWGFQSLGGIACHALSVCLWLA